jgi:hypothetical protein
MGQTGQRNQYRKPAAPESLDLALTLREDI